jgi:hypothetical protein
MNDRNQAFSGKYKIKGNKLCVKLFGYNQTLGKMCKQLGTYTLIPGGFVQKWYYLDNHGHYKLYLTVTYTLLL